MPDLLLELFSEEIPARMQARAAEDLRKLVTGRLVEAGLVYEGAKAFATPRRLALAVEGVPARQPDVIEEKKGPRVGAPEGAIKGFLKSAGLASIDAATIQKDPKKGDFYVALIEKPGRAAIEVLAEIIPAVVREFPWPKSMRWGSGDLRWVRPLHAIVATFGPQTEDPEVVQFSIDGIAAGDETRGHRFMAPEPFRVRRLDDYMARLEKAKVVLDPARRQDMIRADAKNLAFAQGLELVEDEALLAEVAGLVEWPVVLIGAFEPRFLEIPAEVIRTTIRNNQKCFVLRDPETAKLTNRFVLVANIEAADGGKEIVAGNERVIRARLSDAKFFWQTDLKVRLEDRLPKLNEIVFHEKLGTQAARVDRLVALADAIATDLSGRPDFFAGRKLAAGDLAAEQEAYRHKVRRAALLCKADLVTDMVGEFPELQGLMGKYYAEAQGEDAAVAHAIEDHYRPQGPADLVPGEPVSIAVALADKLDTLAGFWAIDERPTSSKDPYGLRRAALGTIRIILENELRLRLRSVCFEALREYDVHRAMPVDKWPQGHDKLSVVEQVVQLRRIVAEELLQFFVDRLKVQLRDRGTRHDLVDAVFALDQDDLLMIVRRVEALGQFLDTFDGQNLLAGYRRANNILSDEEMKDGRSYAGAPDPHLYLQPEERELAASVRVAGDEAAKAVAREDFAAAMSAIAKLRPHVDAFFDKVTVNVEMSDRRENRLKLLNQIRQATRAVADFSRIEGSSS